MNANESTAYKIGWTHGHQFVICGPETHAGGEVKLLDYQSSPPSPTGNAYLDDYRRGWHDGASEALMNFQQPKESAR